MHINALLFAALLPSVALAYGYPTGSGVAFPTGGGNHTRHNGTSCGKKSKTHLPYTKGSGLFFANATSGYAGPTGTGLGTSYLSGTGVSQGASVSSKAVSFVTYTIIPEAVTSSVVHAPFTKGAAFTNTTSSFPVETAGGVFHEHSFGGSSGFASPTASYPVYTVIPVPEAETTTAAPITTTVVVSELPGHPLYTKGSAWFGNSSAPAYPTASGYPTGSGYPTTFVTSASAVSRF